MHADISATARRLAQIEMLDSQTQTVTPDKNTGSPYKVHVNALHHSEGEITYSNYEAILQ